VRGDEVFQNREAFFERRLTGISRMRPDGSDMRPRIPPSCLTWLIEPRAPEVAIMKTGLSGFCAACMAPVTSSDAFDQT
jgi:hypothetical protein